MNIETFSRGWNFVETYVLPVFVFGCILLGLLGLSHAYTVAISVGLLIIVWNGYQEISEGRYALDYVAFLAMLVALVTGQELAGAIVTLMFTGGKALETFASSRAESALRKLSDTIPKKAFVFKDSKYTDVPLQDIKDGERILIKRSELVPLDGTLYSDVAIMDMANLTGEAEPVEVKHNVLIKSGAVNVGDTIELIVVGDFSSSTYHNIVKLVEEAKSKPSRFVRLSARASVYFTAFTLVFAAIAFLIGGTTSLLAVLVIATPCPLIIAAPVAFISGMSRLARRKVIIKQPTMLELLDQTNVIFFDKTGTLTLGEPQLVSIERIGEKGKNYSEEQILSIAAGLEIHSLHPLARTLVNEARKRGVDFGTSALVHEKLGEGIGGVIEGKSYRILGKDTQASGITLTLALDEEVIAEFHFVDQLKDGVSNFINKIKEQGIVAEVITGDTLENAKEVFKDIDIPIRAGVMPEDKYRIVEEARGQGNKVVMIGDGLNDAPALARADVGIVFSGAENAASINAADIVMFDHKIEKVDELMFTSRRTMRIARQSVYVGIALSVGGMVLAAFGFITPVMGALIQEAIDVIVILNALRALGGVNVDGK